MACLSSGRGETGSEASVRCASASLTLADPSNGAARPQRSSGNFAKRPGEVRGGGWLNDVGTQRRLRAPPVYAGDDGCAPSTVERDSRKREGAAARRHPSLPSSSGRRVRIGVHERTQLMQWPWHRRSAEPEALATPPAPPPPIPVAVPDLSDLENQARYHRDRLALYRAKMHGPKQTSVARLQELQRAATAAEDRLATARRHTAR